MEGTGDHGEVAEFVEAVEAENGVQIDAPVPDSYIIQFEKGLLHAQHNVANFILRDLFRHLPPDAQLGTQIQGYVFVLKFEIEVVGVLGDLVGA